VSERPEGPYARGLEQTLWYGLLATVFLYLALLPGPLYAVFPNAPGKEPFIHARRAFGMGAALLATLHAWHGFYGWVGGFEGLESWSWDYNLSLLLGTVALGIVVLLAFTSVDRVVSAMGPAWKRLHRWVYAAAVLVYAHAAIITIHVLDLQPWLVGSFVALVVLLLLEALRIRRAVSLRGAAREWVIWPLFALTCGVAYWSHFLISHHRH
jgi:DMSO/TMAO reductase YedYZ heme-binding membrane subunit